VIQSDGSLISSSFNLQFDDLKTKKGGELVRLSINNKDVDIRMFTTTENSLFVSEKLEDKSSNVPTSDQLKRMNLKDGHNSVQFVTVASNQQANASIFVWKHNAKIIISDIDGTITKSDVRGHVLSSIGMSWHHDGVAPLFQQISAQGYQLMYITARSFKLTQRTRSYLEKLQLPKGPLLCATCGIRKSLIDEVYYRDPSQHKLKHMMAVSSIFPVSEKPFFAAFGNTQKDDFCYSCVGVPSEMTFNVNKHSQIEVKILGVSSTSYSKMIEFVPTLFPKILENLPNQIESIEVKKVDVQ